MSRKDASVPVKGVLAKHDIPTPILSRLRRLAEDARRIKEQSDTTLITLCQTLGMPDSGVDIGFDFDTGKIWWEETKEEK